MLEHAGALPTESASLAFPGGDKLILGLNVQSTGQSHATVFGRLLARTARHRSRARSSTGTATPSWDLPASPRSARARRCAAGNAIVKTADVMLAKGKKIASALLEASEVRHPVPQRQLRGGRHRPPDFAVRDRQARQGHGGARRDRGKPRHQGQADTPLTFPNGCHIAEVEIDPDTGAVDLVTYTAVDDCGNMLDPMIVEGQVHGSLAQGLGQALMENAVYDPASGQLVTGSFMDYAMPRAHDMPVELREAAHPVPATSNPLGVKGTGEAGTTAAIAAVMNAIAHAIPNGAADHMDMPATPAKVWEACQKAMAK